MGATNFAAQGCFVHFLAGRKGRRVVCTGQTYERQGQHMLGTDAETFLWGHCALFRAVWPAYPITLMGSKGLKEGDRGSWQGICSQSYTLFFSTPSFAAEHLKDKGHLSPCPTSPRSLGLKMDSQDHTSSSRSSLSAFFSRLSRDRNRAFQHRKHLMTP